MVPSLLSVVVFVVLWWFCIRPTLNYHQAFGRGPLLMNVIAEASDPHQPQGSSADQWNRDALESARFRVTHTEQAEEDELVGMGPVLGPLTEDYSSSTETGPPRTAAAHFPISADASSTSSERAPLLQPYIGDVDGRASGCGCSNCHGCSGCRGCWGCSRAPQQFSLKPRRIARLPPTLLAAFLVVAYLAVTVGMVASSIGISIGSFFLLCCTTLSNVPCFCLFADSPPHRSFRFRRPNQKFSYRLHTVHHFSEYIASRSIVDFQKFGEPFPSHVFAHCPILRCAVDCHLFRTVERNGSLILSGVGFCSNYINYTEHYPF